MPAVKAIITASLMVVMLMLCGVSARADEPVTPTPGLTPAETQALSQKTEKAFKSAARSLDLQTDMPVKKEMKTQELPKFHISPELARILLIGAIIVILVIVILSFNSNKWSDSRARKLQRESEDEIDTIATVARMEKAQLEADELARAGNYAEAMHMLLLQSVNELRRRLRVSIAVSLTSREILQRIGLPPEGHDYFADIISRVEISYFGSHQPQDADYRACRVSYDSLTSVLSQGGAAA